MVAAMQRLAIKWLPPQLSPHYSLRVVETRLLKSPSLFKTKRHSADDAILKADAERLDLLADNAHDG